MSEAIPNLSGTELSLWRGEDGRLWTQGESGPTAVRVVRCFPWSDPGSYISLRDADDDEVALVRDVSDLKPDSRRALAYSLLEAGFVLEIEAIIDVEEEIEIRTFEVRTRQGVRKFQTMRDEWPRDLPGGGLLIRDVVGDLYLLRDPKDLDAKSQKLLWAFLD
jgi:hypothetical protein